MIRADWLHPYRSADAEVVVVALGSVLGTIKDLVDTQRDAGRAHRCPRDHLVPTVPGRRRPDGARGGPAGSSWSRRPSASASAASSRPTWPWRSPGSACPWRRWSPAWVAVPSRRPRCEGSSRPPSAAKSHADVPRPQREHRRARARTHDAAPPVRPDGGEHPAGPRHRGVGDRVTVPVRFYQVGSFAVGNRLADPGRSDGAVGPGTLEFAHVRPSGLPGLRRSPRCPLRARRRHAGHRRTHGGGERHRMPRGVLDAVPRDVVADRLAAFAVRKRAGGRHRCGGGATGQGPEETRVIGQAGDGGTVDIGFGCLSGMFERNDDVLFICYDNQAYMNTGVQRSGATPPAARTATTEAVGPEPGQHVRAGQEPARLAMAHGIPYVATATVADLHDLEAKVDPGHVGSRRPLPPRPGPVPPRLGAAPGDTVRIARLATQTGLFPVFEAEYGEVAGVIDAPPAGSRQPTTCGCRAASPISSTRTASPPGPTSSTPCRRWPTTTSDATASGRCERCSS